MKFHVLFFAFFLYISSAIAQNAPEVWPRLLAQFPTVPRGSNSAIVPMPQLGWLQRVKTNVDNSHKNDSSIDLIFDGDSITDFWQVCGKEVWKKNYSNRHAFNFGIAGDRTQHLIWRLDQGQVENIHPKLIAIMIGTNNIGANTPEEIAEGIKTVVADYKKHCPEAVILLQAVLPRGEKADNPIRGKIKTINEIISKVADGEKIIYVDFGNKFLLPDGNMSRDIMPDFLHPSAKGYEIWAESIAHIVDKYVPSKNSGI